MVQRHKSHIGVDGNRDEPQFSLASRCQSKMGLIHGDVREALHRQSASKKETQRQHGGPDADCCGRDRGFRPMPRNRQPRTVPRIT